MGIITFGLDGSQSYARVTAADQVSDDVQAEVVSIGRGDSVVLADDPPRFLALARLRPDEDLLDLLTELENPDGYLSQEDIAPIDMNNTVNDEPWGWVRAEKPFCETEDGDWSLIPLNFHSTSINLSSAYAGTDFGSIMDGVITVDVLFDPRVSLEMTYATDEGGWLGVVYDPDYEEMAKAPVDILFRQIMDGWADRTPCPCCQEGGQDGGWTVRISIPPQFEQWAWGQVYQPCDEHRTGCSFSELTWTGEHWIVNEVPK